MCTTRQVPDISMAYEISTVPRNLGPTMVSSQVLGNGFIGVWLLVATTTLDLCQHKMLHHGTLPILVQVMACCLMPSQEPMLTNHLSSLVAFTLGQYIGKAQDPWYEFDITNSRFTAAPPSGYWVNGFLIDKSHQPGVTYEGPVMANENYFGF